jgi:fido (protein-threonine AMPylation protein)
MLVYTPIDMSSMDAMRVSESINRSELEIFNTLKADEFVHDLVDRGVSLTEQVVREINKLLLHELRSDAGEFRQGPVELPGAPFEPPTASDVPELVHELCEMYPLGEALHPVVQAAWVHGQLTLIHPFCDGNGRTGRLLQDLTLLRRGLLPVGIPPAQRDDYYGALESGDRGAWDQIVEMLADLELKMIARTESIAREPEKRTAWITRLASAAAQKATDTQHKKYLVWRQQMQQVTDAFRQAADELDQASNVIGASFKDFGVMDFESWQQICRHGSINRSWHFTVLSFAEGQAFYKSIGYAKRHLTKPWDSFEPEWDTVGLYFTGIPIPSGDRPDFSNYDDPHIRLREILFLERGMIAMKQVPAEDRWEQGSETSVAEVVENFFIDVFERKAGLGA